MRWLVNHETENELHHGVRSGRLNCTATEREAFTARSAARGSPMDSGVMVVSGDVAQINIQGLLTKQPSILAWLLGFANTSYADIDAALALADSNPSVKRATLAIDSPGGTVSGLFETLGTLESFSKPLVAVCSLACSAAYAIASKAGKIRAVTPASQFGSIGVAAEIFVDPDTVQIASTNAPNKRPDVTTAEGQGVVRAELDALHDLFVEHIARGRKTTPAKVNTDFGRGGTVIGAEARRRGMIDSVSDPGRKKAVTADPRTEFATWFTQRCHPISGESDTEYANRSVELMDRAHAVRRRNGTLAEYEAVFDDGAPDPAATAGGRLIDLFASDLNRGNPNEPGDLGDQVVARMLAGRGKAPAASTDLIDRFASDLPNRSTRGNPNEPGDLGDRVVARMLARRSER